MHRRKLIPLPEFLLPALLILAAPAVQAGFSYSTNANGTITIDGYSGPEGALVIPIRIGNLPVTSIGYEAFISLTSLTSVTIPDSVSSLGTNAFANCTDLTSVYFEGNAPAADSTVFDGDNNATVYYLPDTTGWSNTFAGRPAMLENTGEAQFLSTTSHGKVTITGYSGPNQVIIPATINNLPVTTIGKEAFINLTSLTSVTIPQGVTSIEDSAFAYCTGLTNVSLPTSLTKLGVDVFFDSGLNSVTIPSSVTSVPGGTFEFCTNLATVFIPQRVTTIGTNAFAYCSALSSVTIPNGVRTLGASAFAYCASLTNATIPGTVNSMGGSAFASCSSLVTVNLAEGVANIATNEFGYCWNLRSISVPASITNIGQYAFFACSNLSTLSVPAKVRAIGDGAFAYCAALAGVTISNGLTAIGDSAFYSCSSLTSVTVPGSVRSIGGDTFAYCDNLASVTISNGTRTIGGDAFEYCLSLSDLSIPASVNSIGVSAFYGCSSLASVSIPNNVSTISDDAFAYCTNLASVTISNGVRGIGESAFYFCSKLPRITIPNGITTIGVSAFYGCSNLALVTIPGSVHSIGDSAFANCPSLANLTISNGVSSIGEYAFSSCPKLINITIPPSVTSVGDWAFENCVNLLSVYFEGNAPNVDSTVFSGDDNAIVYYNPGTSGWSTFAGPPATALSLQVTLAPVAAITAGAQWQVDGGIWHNSGATVAGLSVGSHSLAFSTLSGWTTPPNQTITIRANSVTRATATYAFTAQGLYNGLFMQTNVTAQTAGMLSDFSVTASGTYSGKLLIGATTNAVTGVFDISGQASNFVERTLAQGGPLALNMTLNWNDSPPTITGAVSGNNGLPWEAFLTNLAAVTASSSAEYTAWLLPAGTPPGYGYLLITNRAGMVTLSAALADGTSFSQTVPLSGAGSLPIYGSLYGGTGLLLGWLDLENGSLTGNLTWVKPASASSSRYATGFTNSVIVQGSPWTNPPPNTAAIDLPSGQLAISGGNLPNMTFNIAVNNDNALVKLSGGSTNSLTGSINPKTGLLTLTFGHGSGKSTTTGVAAVLQNVTSAAGYFLGNTNAGSILLSP